MAELVGVNIEPVFKENHLGDFLDSLTAARRISLKGQRTEHSAAARIGYLQILEHGKVFEHRRRLELRPTPACTISFSFIRMSFLAAELDRA